jgi:hypothetical protein
LIFNELAFLTKKRLPGREKPACKKKRLPGREKPAWKEKLPAYLGQ